MDAVYAFQYQPEFDRPLNGWEFADLTGEYRRLLSQSREWVVTDVNKTCVQAV